MTAKEGGNRGTRCRGRRYVKVNKEAFEVESSLVTTKIRFRKTEAGVAGWYCF